MFTYLRFLWTLSTMFTYLLTVFVDVKHHVYLPTVFVDVKHHVYLLTYGVCGREATQDSNMCQLSEFRSCVKVEVARP